MSWLDRYAEEQREQREALERVASPFLPSEVCEVVDEDGEPPIDPETGLYKEGIKYEA